MTSFTHTSPTRRPCGSVWTVNINVAIPMSNQRCFAQVSKCCTLCLSARLDNTSVDEQHEPAKTYWRWTLGILPSALCFSTSMCTCACSRSVILSSTCFMAGTRCLKYSSDVESRSVTPKFSLITSTTASRCSCHTISIAVTLINALEAATVVAGRQLFLTHAANVYTMSIRQLPVRHN
jgi:hypothetical protein